MIRNIIFDWSGTLVDDLPAVLAATNAVFQECGVEPLSLHKFRAEFCLPFKHFYDRFVPNVPIAELERSFHSHFRREQDKVAALPHAREFLLFCRQRGLRTFVLSTVHPDYFALQAGASGFDQFIEQGKVESLREKYGLTAEAALEKARPYLAAIDSRHLALR